MHSSPLSLPHRKLSPQRLLPVGQGHVRAPFTVWPSSGRFPSLVTPTSGPRAVSGPKKEG